MSIPKAAAAFPRSEYIRRLAATKARMAEVGVDVLLVTSSSNIAYLTGYVPDTSYVPQWLVVNAAQEEPDLCLRPIDEPAGVHSTFLARERVSSYSEDCIGQAGVSAYDHMYRQFESVLGKGRIGVELQSLSYPAATELRERIGADRTVDCSLLVDWVRLVKSDLEIEVMRKAAHVSDMTIQRAGELIGEGARELDVAAEMVGVQIRGLPEHGSVSLAMPLINSTPRTGTPHFHWVDTVYAAGTQINIEIGGTLHRYAAGLMRTFHVGPPPERLRRIHAAEVEGMEQALAAARPGATCADVAGAFHAAINRHGFEKASRCGYAIGINWLETTASLNMFDHTVLQPNMTFHLMLGNWIDEDFGYTISETFRITDTGSESFARTPRDLFIR